MKPSLEKPWRSRARLAQSVGALGPGLGKLRHRAAHHHGGPADSESWGENAENSGENHGKEWGNPRKKVRIREFSDQNNLGADFAFATERGYISPLMVLPADLSWLMKLGTGNFVLVSGAGHVRISRVLSQFASYYQRNI